MIVNASDKVQQQTVEMEGASGCQVRWLLGQPEGVPNFAMRKFEVAPGGHTPHHHHPYEHEVYVLEGEGMVVEGNVKHPIQAGDVIYVAPDDVHQFRNTGPVPLKFLCLVPNSATNQQVHVTPECGAESKS